MSKLSVDTSDEVFRLVVPTYMTSCNICMYNFVPIIPKSWFHWQPLCLCLQCRYVWTKTFVEVRRQSQASLPLISDRVSLLISAVQTSLDGPRDSRDSVVTVSCLRKGGLRNIDVSALGVQSYVSSQDQNQSLHACAVKCFYPSTSQLKSTLKPFLKFLLTNLFIPKKCF